MFTTKEHKTIDNVVTELLQEIKQYYPDDYMKLVNDDSQLQSIKDVAREVAEEQVTLAKEFPGEVEDIRERLAKHLPESRIKLIEEGLKVPTFRIRITKQDDGNYLVAIKTEKGDLCPPRVLTSAADIEWATFKQYASIVVEAVMLVLQAAGIAVAARKYAIQKACDVAYEEIETSSKFRRVINKFVEVWNNSGSNWAKATSLFTLTKGIYDSGILWKVIKTLCQDMSWFDWIKTAAKTGVMIIAALATDGVALIAKIALCLWKAVEFSEKIANLNQLETISDIIS